MVFQTTSQLRGEIKDILVQIYDLCHIPIYEEIFDNEIWKKEKEPNDTTSIDTSRKAQSKHEKKPKSYEVNDPIIFFS